MYVLTRRAVIKEEAVSSVKEGYESDVKGPVVTSKGNRFFVVLNSVDREREVRQMTGWESKEDCDRYLNEVYPKIFEKWEWVFEEKPQASFWELKWPATVQFDPKKPPDSMLFVRASRFKLKPEAVAVVRERYENEVMGPVIAAQGNRFFCVLLSVDEEGVGSQVTGWDSKEDWDQFYAQGYGEAMKDWWWAFDERPTATFWEIKWPGSFQF